MEACKSQGLQGSPKLETQEGQWFSSSLNTAILRPRKSSCFSLSPVLKDNLATVLKFLKI